MAANIILPGHLNRDDLRVWYSASDIGIMSSYTEQCSYAALEMMNAGIPIVSSDGNGLCDMFKDGENAFIAHINDINNVDAYSLALANAIERAIKSSQSNRNKLICASHELLRTKYSTSSMIQKYIAIFESLMNSHNIS